MLSDKTKTIVPLASILMENDLYPDRSATDNSIKNKGQKISRLPLDEFPRTTQDMSKLYQWKPGDVIRGSFAKSNTGMMGYIRDIEGAPNESEYKANYINPYKLVSEKLKKSKK